MTDNLFLQEDPLPIADDAWLLKGYAAASAGWILQCARDVVKLAPLRHMQVPSGYTMSVKTSSCGDYGWVTDHQGYRYSKTDPLTGQRWPQMPQELYALATRGAAEVGFDRFTPDSCLINCYRPGSKMGLHQDKDERDRSAPIVSLSFGLPVTFMFGGLKRSDAVKRFTLEHGDLLVWGGCSRMAYHGVAPLKAGDHPMLGPVRLNLTFRQAG